MDGNGADWRDRQPIAQSVHVRPYLVWLVTHAEYLDMVRARARGITETDELVAPPSLDEQAAARVRGRRA